jgi:hypothetical protein
MADNITAKGNVGAGTEVIAADDISGVLYPRTKLVLGADGANDGDVSAANPMPIEGTVTVLGVAQEETLQTSMNTLTAIDGYFKAEDTAHVSGDKGMPLLAIRYASDTTTTDADGDYTNLKVDEEGRLKVASKPASYTATTGTITANAQTVFVNCERFSNLMIHCTGTFSTVNVTFEGSLNSTNGTDGSWFGVQAVRSNANTIETTTGNLSAAPAYAWELSVNALKWFRVRATAFTSGTQTWTFVPGTYATEPIPAAQISGTQPVSGTLTSAGTTTNTPATPTADNYNSAATTNARTIKATAGTVYNIVASNANAAVRYLKLYNTATAPTVGTTVPVLTIAIPAAGTTPPINFGAMGHRFSTGISMALTTGVADSDTAAVAANEIKVVTSYI